jgi:hypothetical protein
MILDEIKEYLQQKVSAKIIGEMPIYFDNFTFSFNSRYLYFGLLNSGFTYQIITPFKSVTILRKKSNPVFFNNIQGSFTFIGHRIEFSDSVNFDFSQMPDFHFGEFNNDFGNDFAT